MRNEHVRQFYGDSLGWNMFDAKFLTPALEEFLDIESASLSEVFETHPQYNHLVEVGCGYGRYLNFALDRSLAYDGLDLVPWLINIGKIRVQRAQGSCAHARCAVHNLSAEKLSALLDDPIANRRKWCSMVFFPFNCFGNIARLREVMETLQKAGSDVFISTFQLDAVTTELRKTYYANCGFRRLESRLCDQGVIITSEEGLHAYAYSQEFLTDLFAEYGFQCNSIELLGRIGIRYHFVKIPVAAKPGEGIPVKEQRRSDRVEAHLSLTISALVEEIEQTGITLPGVRYQAPGTLMAFENNSGVSRNISPDGVLATSPRRWEPGTIVKIEMSFFDQPETLLQPLLFVGTVERVIPRPDETFDIAVQFCQAEPEARKSLARKLQVLS